MDKNKYYLNFNDFINKLDNLDKVKIPKGYKQINAKKNSEENTKHKVSIKR